MGLNPNGHVLRTAQVAPSNAASTGEVNSGVIRFPTELPDTYVLKAQAPELVDVLADQYRTAIMNAPGTTPVEYLVWAANSSQLAISDDADWWTEAGFGTIPPEQETTRIVVTDNGLRQLSSILAVVVARGDVTYDDDGWVNPEDPSDGRKGNTPYLVLLPGDYTANAFAGIVEITSVGKLATLGGGLSRERGDQIITVRYTVAPAKFWWTRNDRYATRFGWNGQTRRWEPWQGSSVKALGTLLFGNSYKLDPKPPPFPIGTFLPSSATADAYSMLRLGTDAGSGSLPIEEIRVVADADVSDYDFDSDPVEGIAGQTTGRLVFNPAFLTQYAGQALWYSYQGFNSTSNGVVGKMLGAAVHPLYLAPIPGPLDFPFIRFGNRKNLVVSRVETDAALLSAGAPASGTVILSNATGRLRFNSTDLAKADPESVSFDKSYFGEDVVFAGVALNAQPQSVRPPVRLVNGSGDPATAEDDDLYIPNALTLPDLGVSGILDAPDGTGALPALVDEPASLRPGGDSTVAATTGRVRAVTDGLGDTIIFGKTGAIRTVVAVDTEDDLPAFFGRIEQGTALVVRQWHVRGSKVGLSSEDRALFEDSPLYFQQATFTPAYTTTKALLVSRIQSVFRFTGEETFYFAVNGTARIWTPTALLTANPSATSFTPAEVAAAIQSDTTPTLPANTAVAAGAYLQLKANTSIEVGFGAGGTKDLSGCTALGFLPGWRVVEGQTHWLNDSGASLGLFRSPANLDRSLAVPDFSAVDRVEDEVLIEDISAQPYVFLDNPPLQDIAGYDEGVFFTLTTTVVDGDEVQLIQTPLRHYEEVIHRFGQKRFDWILPGVASGEVEHATTTLGFGQANVVPESLLDTGGIPGGLVIAEDGGAGVMQDPDTDFLLPSGGQPGNALLVERFGSVALSGAQGQTTTEFIFTDPDVDFSDIEEGYRLKILSGPAAGSYIVRMVEPDALTIDPGFPELADEPLTWEIHQSFHEEVYDPALVADKVYESFEHLQEETFKIRLLSRVGNVGDANPTADLDGTNGRELSLRFGLVAPSETNTADLIPLTVSELGIIANGALTVPDNAHLNGYFSVQIGATRYTEGVNLIGVTTFSSDPGANVEYLTQVSGGDPKGRLKFGTGVLSSHQDATVFYREEFLASALLDAGYAEYDPNTGELNLSSDDMTTYAGERLYFVKQLLLKNRQDATINPILGAFTPNVPVPVGTAVEVEYWRADVEGRRIGDLITEFLPVFVENETAELIAPGVYRFNLDLNTIDTTVTPAIWVGNVEQNFGRTDCIIDYPSDWNGYGRIVFVNKVDATLGTVTVTYAVYEAQGGEKSYNASSRPLYRPPFFIKARQTQFGLRGDRTADFQPGQMLRVGPDCFYLRSLTYYPTQDITAVGIFPQTAWEVGSRSPGNDNLLLVSADPITTTVDPDGDSPVVTDAGAGFMSEINLAVFPFEPVVQGQDTIVFRGDLTAYAVAGHILEIGGMPYTIANARLVDEGTRTRIALTGVVSRGISVAEDPTVKLSYRPVYPPGTTDFLGCGPVVDSETVELVCFGKTNEAGDILPGETLVPEVDYHLDTVSGRVSLLGGPLESGQKLLLTFTRLKTLKPFLNDGVLVKPRYAATFLYTAIPDAQNGLLGGQINATYTFSSPDSFYFRAVPLQQFLSEVATQAVQEIASKAPASGALKPVATAKNWDQGRIGLLGEKRNLQDKDRAARAFLNFYNGAVLAFEQVQETISGAFIGDRDGKFRFNVGYGKDYPTPGYEDAISGLLTPRNIWSEVFNSERDGNPIPLQISDWLVTPESAAISDGKLTGDLPNTDTLRQLVEKQKPLIRNDVDDLVLLRQGSMDWGFFFLRARGEYANGASPTRFSRLFPTVTNAFFRLSPGAGAVQTDGVVTDPGVYTFGRTLGGRNVSTYKQQIGQLSNPVVGVIANVREAALEKRYARGRVWGYYPDGLKQDALGTGIPAADLTVPVVLAFPIPLSEVPVDPDTGLPDVAKLRSNGGTVSDAQSGDPTLLVPGFEGWLSAEKPGEAVYFGKPDGRTWMACSNDTWEIIGGPEDKEGLTVAEVLYGCVIVFRKANATAYSGIGNALSASDDLRVRTGLNESIPVSELPLTRGDTIFGGAPVAQDDLGSLDVDEAPPLSTMLKLSQRSPTFRSGWDLGVEVDGSITDRSLPSINDPAVPLKEIFGQNVPEPMSFLEGEVEFLYTGNNPLLIPALSGEQANDSGDISIPYMKTGMTEYERFDQAQTDLAAVMKTESGGAYVYPDEIQGDDGSVNVDAEFATTSDLTPVTNGDLTPGIGDLRPFDFVFVQAPQTGAFVADASPNPGPLGWLTAATVTEDTFEPPRFVTRTRGPVAAPDPSTGSAVRYIMRNAMVWTAGPYPAVPNPGTASGVKIIETATETILDFSSTTIALNNGATAGVGNLNELVESGSRARITIRVLARPDSNINDGPAVNPPNTGGVETLRIVIEGQTITTYHYGDLNTPYATVNVNPLNVVFGTTSGGVLPTVLANRQIVIPATGLLPWDGPFSSSTWFLPYTYDGLSTEFEMNYADEVIIDVDAQNSAEPSLTAWIDEDRLTFHEVYDLAQAKPRGTTHTISGLDLETSLVVHGVTVGIGSGSQCLSAVNKYVNGLDGADPIPLTFKIRTGQSTVGTWTARAGSNPEKGSLKAMAFEGHDNTPITGSDVIFSAVPSFDATTICEGTGQTGSQYNAALSTALQESLESRLTEISVSAGRIADVQPGDMVSVTGSGNASHSASVHVGTYLVRHAVVPTGADTFRKLSPVAVSDGWCPVQFPRVVGYNTTTHVLTTTDYAPVAQGTALGGDKTGFPSVGARVYIIRNVSDLAATDLAKFKLAVVSAQYSALATNGDKQGLFTLTDWKDAVGAALTENQFAALLETGFLVSGMTYLPVRLGGSQYGLPDNNVVGHNVAGEAYAGFRRLTFESPVSGTSPVTYTISGLTPAVPVADGGIGAASDVRPLRATPVGSNAFVSDPMTAIYHNVVDTLQLSNVTSAVWKKLNVPVTSAGYSGTTVNCLLPATKLALYGPNDTGTREAGFYAQGGIFLEPSVPRTSLNLVADHPRVVNEQYSLVSQSPLSDDNREIGMRDGNFYRVSGTTVTTAETVTFEVRRIRRFHEAATATQNLIPLKYAYEIRRGRVTGYSQNAKQTWTIIASQFDMDWEATKPAGAPKASDVWNDGGTYSGTNLGFFNDPDVNVHPGDSFRLLDEQGQLVDEAEIISVGEDWITLAAPGITQVTASDTPGMRFEIWLRHAPVPHEQSNEQLLALVSDRVVLQSDPTWGEAQEKGGYVPEVTGVGVTYETQCNKLRDDLKATGTGSATFPALGVQRGDIVLVDPLGTIPKKSGLPALQEKSVRPLGDDAVSQRTTAYTAGRPNPLDDNRGFYRVSNVTNTELEVSEVSAFSGTAASPMVFDSSDADRAYAVLPTVHDSLLGAGGLEGQQDLRPTKARNVGTGTYKATSGGHSIRPFAYKVIRPSKLFRDETIDLVLFTRERTLSLIEFLRGISRSKGGTYYVWQRDNHISDLGSPTDPELGLGLMSNAYLTSLMGRIEVVPFANGSGCLSILDRRFWILDSRLDGLTYDGSVGMKVVGTGETPYTQYETVSGSKVRPVLPDLIDRVLNNSDRLRPLRYIWLSYRTHRTLGTLASIARFDAEYPERLAEQQRLMAQKISLENVIDE